MKKEFISLGELEKFLNIATNDIDGMVGAAQIAFMIDEKITAENMNKFALSLKDFLGMLIEIDAVNNLFGGSTSSELGSSVYMSRFKLKDNFVINNDYYYFQPITDYSLDFIPSEISELYALFFRKENEKVDDYFIDNVYPLRKNMFKNMKCNEILETIDIFRYTRFFPAIQERLYKIFAFHNEIFNMPTEKPNKLKKWKLF